MSDRGVWQRQGRATGKPETSGRSRGRPPDRRAGGGLREKRPGHETGTHREKVSPRPDLPGEITASQLDASVRAELRTLPGDLGDAVARWMVAASMEPDPDTAYEYALQARRLAGRVGVVRETSGIAAYRAGRWADALAELRAARRLTGRASYLPMMADSERALARPDRALAIIRDAGTRELDRATQIELRIVESGIRRDEGHPAAGVVALQVPELTDGRLRPWSAQLFYAYGDALLDAGREDEAREWFGKAAAADTEGETDAAERYESLDNVVIEDLAEPDPADVRLAEPDAAEPGVAEAGAVELDPGGLDLGGLDPHESDLEEPGLGEPGPGERIPG